MYRVESVCVCLSVYVSVGTAQDYYKSSLSTLKNFIRYYDD